MTKAYEHTGIMFWITRTYETWFSVFAMLWVVYELCRAQNLIDGLQVMEFFVSNIFQPLMETSAQ